MDLTIPPLGVDLHLDFLPVLQAELAERGLTYDVAARVRNIEAAPLPGVSLLDDDVLVTRGRAYVVEVDGHELDVDRFEGLAAEGRRRLEAGEAEAAGRLLRDALSV